MPLIVPVVDRFQFPIEKFSFGSRFGVVDAWHKNPHRGADYIASEGTPLGACANGVVVSNGWSECLGNTVVVKHKLKAKKLGKAQYVFIGFNHMQRAAGVKVGQVVKRGDILGLLGNTGTCSQGGHVHVTASLEPTGNVWGPVFDATDFINTHNGR